MSEKYYRIQHGTGTLDGHSSIVAPDGFEAFHFAGIVTRLNKQHQRVKELEARLRSDVDSQSPWISVDEFKDIPMGEWFGMFSEKETPLNKDPDPNKRHYRRIMRHPNITTVGDHFSFDRSDWQLEGYMPIPQVNK